MAKNAFDEVLASINDDVDRKATETLVAKYPHLRDGWLKGSDYSRKLDELRDKVTYADKFAAWQTSNLVEREDGTWETLRERELRQKLESVQPTAGKGEDEMTEEQLRAQLESAMAAKGVVDKATLDTMVAGYQQQFKQELEEIRNTFAAVTPLSIQTAKLMMGHSREFGGEELDVDALYKTAQEKKSDLMSAYNDMVATRRKEIADADLAAKIAAAEKAGYEKAKQEVGMSPVGMPDDHSGADMGAVQRRVFAAGPSGEVKLDALPFGEGSLAAHAARTLPVVPGK